jgi:hypothetical protein
MCFLERPLQFDVNTFKKTKKIKDNYFAYLSGFEHKFLGFVRCAHKQQMNSLK